MALANPTAAHLKCKDCLKAEVGIGELVTCVSGYFKAVSLANMERWWKNRRDGTEWEAA